MADTGTSFRRAYQAVVDRTPPPPQWEQLDEPAVPARGRAPRRWSLPPWIMASAAAALLLLVLGGAAMLGLDRGPASTTAATPPAAGGPIATERPSTAVPEFQAVDPPPSRRLPVASVAGSSELENFEAKYLIDGTDRAWNDASLRGTGAELTFTFTDPVQIDEIAVHHLTDPERYARNYRIAQLALAVDGEPVLVTTIPDAPGAHLFDVEREGSMVTLRVLDVYPAETFGGSPPFEELAVGEVEFWGSPSRP